MCVRVCHIERFPLKSTKSWASDVLQVADTVKRFRENNLSLLTLMCFDKELYSLLHNTRNLVYLQGVTCGQDLKGV